MILFSQHVNNEESASLNFDIDWTRARTVGSFGCFSSERETTESYQYIIIYYRNIRYGYPWNESKEVKMDC